MQTTYALPFADKFDLINQRGGRLANKVVIVQAGPGETFGFADNVNSLPFADKLDLTNQPGGRLANKVVI